MQRLRIKFNKPTCIIEKKNGVNSVVFKLGRFCPPGDIWMPKYVFGGHTGGQKGVLHLAGKGQGYY